MRIELTSGRPINNIQSETYLDIALQDWLTGKAWKEEAKRPFLRLAETLIENHHDHWLADFVTANSSPRADQLLQSAIAGNHNGDLQHAVASAAKSRQAFRRAGNRAGAARSEFELVYALQRQSRAKECIREIPLLTQLLAGKSYRWLEIQRRLEISSCTAMSTDFDSAWRAASAATDEARVNGYQLLALRALGYRAEFHTLEGRLGPAWQSNVLALQSFWMGSFPSDRGFQFYFDLERAAERLNQLHLAALLQSEALEMLSGTNHTDSAAVAHFQLGAILGTIGLDRESEREIDQARALLAQLPATSSTALYQSYCDILLATLEIHRGARPAALNRLQRASGSIQRVRNFDLRLRYLNAFGEAARLGGDSQEEEKLLTESVSVAKSGFGALHSERDRWDWEKEAGATWRRLLELKMKRPHKPAQGLVEWESYRSYQALGRAQRAIFSDNSERVTREFRTRLNRLNGTALVFAVFPDQVVVWVAGKSQIQEFKLPISEHALGNEVQSFYRLCSDSSSSLAKVREAGLRLYQLLLAPVERAIEDEQTLFIEADGMLGLIPWPAVTMNNGRYLGDSYTLINTRGLLRHQPPHAAGATHTLVVYPGPIKLLDELFPPLPGAEAEAEFIAKLSPGSVYLQGEQATAGRILGELPKSTTFYFTGHAVEREYGGELLIRGPTGGDVISASHLDTLNLSRTKLVVLSACSTALAPGNIAGNPNGLVGAFLNAGANEVVASRWNVDSSMTSALMLDFYRNFQEGRSAATALAAAQRDLRSRRPELHPYYWASFQTFGTH